MVAKDSQPSKAKRPSNLTDSVILALAEDGQFAKARYPIYKCQRLGQIMMLVSTIHTEGFDHAIIQKKRTNASQS